VIPVVVIPAKAGIHPDLAFSSHQSSIKGKMGSSFRWNDGR
jgi:hypothetical protein